MDPARRAPARLRARSRLLQTKGPTNGENTDVLYGKAKGRVPRAPAGTFVIGSGLTTEAAVRKGKAQAPLDGVHGVKILNQGKAAALDGVPADGKIRNQAKAAALDGVLRDGNFRNQAKAAALDGAGVLTVTAGRVANTPRGVAAVEAAVEAALDGAEAAAAAEVAARPGPGMRLQLQETMRMPRQRFLLPALLLRKLWMVAMLPLLILLLPRLSTVPMLLPALVLRKLSMAAMLPLLILLLRRLSPVPMLLLPLLFQKMSRVPLREL